MIAFSIDEWKNAERSKVWDVLTAHSVVHDADVHGRIPNFVDAHLAAARLAELPAWETARVIKVVPDKAQLPVRARALCDGKIVYMAVPQTGGTAAFLPS